MPSDRPSHITALRIALSETSFIYEQKNDSHFTSGCGRAIVHTSCAVLLSEHRQRYVLTTTTLPRQSVEQTLEWIKGGTDVRIVLTGESFQPVAADMAGTLVDSFYPVTYKNLPVTYIDDSRV